MTPAAVADLHRRDRAARLAAQTVFDRPVVLEAGAGTGKTTTLVARLLAWALGTGWRRAEEALGEAAAFRGEAAPPEGERVAARILERTVAITFTEAAAAEMAARTADELTAIAGAGDLPEWLDAEKLPPSEERARRAAALLATLDHLQVSTIHAWCLGLLAAHPIEAGLHPRLEVDAEGRIVEAAVRETVESALRDAYGDPPDPAFLALAARGKGPPEIVAALVALIAAGVPSAALDRDPTAGPESTALVAELAAAARTVHGLIAPRLGGSQRHLERAREVRDALDGLAADLAGGAAGQALGGGLRARLPAELRDRIAAWAKERGGKTEAERFADCRRDLAAAAAELVRLVDHAARLDPDLLAAARTALAPLLARIERDLVARGVLGFHDLLARAAALLGGRPEVRARERRRIDQLLVDEFQDTDRLQCELVGWLALDGPVAERPGLFLVGDPKQSIYGWRNADLAAYDSFLARVREAGGEVHPLIENFRSAPPILTEVERAVAPVMEEERGLQPRFEPLLPCDRRRHDLGFTAGGRAAVEYWVSWPADDGEGAAGAAASSEAATRLEAAAVACDVVDLHLRSRVPWREIGLLLRATGDLDVYLEALRERGVPFAVARDKQYYRRREVIEAAALVRAVLDPGDHVALLTVLRSAMVGVPDAALIPLWRRKLPRRLTDLGGGDDERDAARLARLAEDVAAAAREVPAGIRGLDRLARWPAALLAAAEHLTLARRSFRRDPADRFVDTVRRLFLIEPIEAARYLGPYRLANLERFFTRLVVVLEQGGGDTAAVLRALRKSVAEALDAQEARPEEGADDAVQVMTIHTAKGLDFAHVYLLQLHRQTGGDPDPEVEAAATVDGWEYRLFGVPTPGFHRVEAQRRRVEAAERVRTLYVAMTRAKDRLVLAGRWEEQPAERPPAAARHHLDLLVHRPGRPALQELWGELPATADAGISPHCDPHGVLWRFPAAGATPEEATAGDVERPTLPPPDEVERAAEALASRCAAAARRAARPFSRAASEDAHRLLRERAAEREGYDDGDGGPRGEERREAAMAAGAAVHRALELFDVAADPAEEGARQRAALAAYVTAAMPGTVRPSGDGGMTAAGGGSEATVAEAALARAAEIFDRFAGGALLARLRGLGGHLLARELPVLLPPPAPAQLGTAEGDDGPPVGFVAGTVDLLYRDPMDGALVVADYKTDRAASAEELAERYAGQGGVYVAAVRDGLGLAGESAGAIRFEIWSLPLDRVVPVAIAPSTTTAPDLAAAEDADGDRAGGPAQLSLFSNGE